MPQSYKTKEEHPSLLVTVKLLNTRPITLVIKNRIRDELVAEIQSTIEDDTKQLLALMSEDKSICFNKNRLEYYTVEKRPN